MPLHLFLNELSFVADECTQGEAVRRLKVFAGTLGAAGKISDEPVLNADTPIADLVFGADWPLARLYNVAECAEERLFLKSFQDRTPYGETVGVLGGLREAEFEYRLDPPSDEFTAAPRGLGLTHAYAGLSLSLANHQKWDVTGVPLVRMFLLPSGDIETTGVEARNASTDQAVEVHREQLQINLRPAINDGVTLWARRAELYPHLEFLPRTKDQIERLLEGSPDLNALVDRLSGLEQSVARWAHTGDAHPTFGFFVRPESRSRLRRGLVDFNVGENRTASFSDHADFGANEGRLHFRLESVPERRAVVGHAARKIGIG